MWPKQSHSSKRLMPSSLAVWLLRAVTCAHSTPKPRTRRGAASQPSPRHQQPGGAKGEPVPEAGALPAVQKVEQTRGGKCRAGNGKSEIGRDGPCYSSYDLSLMVCVPVSSWLFKLMASAPRRLQKSPPPMQAAPQGCIKPPKPGLAIPLTLLRALPQGHSEKAWEQSAVKGTEPGREKKNKNQNLIILQALLWEDDSFLLCSERRWVNTAQSKHISPTQAYGVKAAVAR